MINKYPDANTSKFFFQCDVLCDLILFVQFKKQGKIHGGVLLLVKLQVEAK